MYITPIVIKHNNLHKCIFCFKTGIKTSKITIIIKKNFYILLKYTIHLKEIGINAR